MVLRKKDLVRSALGFYVKDLKEVERRGDEIMLLFAIKNSFYVRWGCLRCVFFELIPRLCSVLLPL
jgi:predicted nucleic-acid-binding Zn-ribbon protein